MNSNGKQLLASLASSPVYREYATAFSEALSLPLALQPPESWQLPFRGGPCENRFCAAMAKSSRACAYCLTVQQRLHEAAGQHPATVSCGPGLVMSAVPVRVDGQLVGFLQTGQVMRTPATAQQFRQTVQLARRWGLPEGTESLRRLYFMTRVVGTTQYRAMIELLSVFAQQLGALGSQMAVRQANAPPPVIRRAMDYIVERHAEALRLPLVARAVNSSPFYLCKLFKRVNGVNFSEFVARTRIEKARNLLLNPDVQVSEIAYAVGFHSLTHFNRTFKKVMGLPPTAYRKQLPAGTSAGSAPQRRYRTRNAQPD